MMKDDQIMKILLKMNITSENGEIYFNELLYRMMREKYVNFRMNKEMTIHELKTQYALLKLCHKNQQKKMTDDAE